MDAQKQSADAELLKYAAQHPGEELTIESDFYIKDALLQRMDTLRKNYAYIEKVFNWDGSKKIVSVFKPAYGTEFRDLYFVDFDNNKILHVIKKWRCGRNADKNILVDKLEEYFTVDLLNSYLYEPIFYKDMVFFNQSYPASLFQKDKKANIDKAIFNWESKQKHEMWYLYRYKFDLQ